MSTPQIQPSKRSRRSSRRTKNTSAGVSDCEQPVTDSAPSPPDTGHSGAATPNTKFQADDQNQYRKPQGPKKTHNLPKADRAPNHRNASPQPNLAPPSQRQGTPIKQAYAGPTFHSSPAPSALPMPSFYSKSLPSIPPTKTPDIVEESQGQVVGEAKGRIHQRHKLTMQGSVNQPHWTFCSRLLGRRETHLVQKVLPVGLPIFLHSKTAL